MLMFRFYILSVLLFGMQILHYLADVPYLYSPLAEFVAVGSAGTLLILWQGLAHWRAIDKQMRKERLRYCPHCHVRCEEFYVVCPKCNRAIMPTQAHESQLPSK